MCPVPAFQHELNFYPRPPRGGRPAEPSPPGVSREISIHALREEGDSLGEILHHGELGISIHALREEGDGEDPIFGKPLFKKDF